MKVDKRKKANNLDERFDKMLVTGIRCLLFDFRPVAENGMEMPKRCRDSTERQFWWAIRRASKPNYLYLFGQVPVLIWKSTCTYREKYLYLFE